MIHRNSLLAGLTLCAGVSAAGLPDAAVPVESEPRHRTVLLNDYVQAFRVTIEPGATTLMHLHAHPDVAVRLSSATVESESPGQPRSAPEQFSPGRVTARENAPAPTIHRVHNVGKTLFDVIDVQVLQRPAGPAATTIAEPAAENSAMRAYRYELPAGASSRRHEHARPYVFAAVTGVELHVDVADGTATGKLMKAGDMEWVDVAVTHTLTNEGTAPAIVVEIELK